MKIAIFSDIHGNIRALDRVLEENDREKPDRVFCLGDLVGYGASPNQVIERLRERDIPTVMGNYDEGVGFDRADCGCAYTNQEDRELGDRSLAWTKTAVIPENKEYLRSLLPEVRENVKGWEVLLVHGSPRRINEYLFADRPEQRVAPMLKKAGADIIVCGHTHLPYHKNIEGIHLINTGSVGKPKSGSPEADFVIINFAEELEVSFRKVKYDWEAAAEDIIKAGLPEKFARQVRTGTP